MPSSVPACSKQRAAGTRDVLRAEERSGVELLRAEWSCERSCCAAVEPGPGLNDRFLTCSAGMHIQQPAQLIRA